MMNGILACINLYYIYHQMFMWKWDVFCPVPGKRDPGLCNRDPASTGTFSSMHVNTCCRDGMEGGDDFGVLK
jgi:hypothetical protein